MRACVGGFWAECGCSIAFDTKDSAMSYPICKCTTLFFCPSLSVSGVILVSVSFADRGHRSGLSQKDLFPIL